MTTQTVRMSGEDFVKKVLAGERDYRGIVLPEGFNLSGYEGFQEMQAYLKGQDLEHNPLDLSGATWNKVTALELHLPYVKAERAYLGKANLREASLYGAYLGKANLVEADLGRAYLVEADLREANLERANLGRADLREANLGGAYLERANLKGVVNLEKSRNLQYAHFYGTRVTQEEKKIIEAALKTKELFVVE